MTTKQLLAGVSAMSGILVLILDGKTAIEGALEGINLCLTTIIPALFPFFLFSNLLTGAFVGSPIRFLRPLGKLFHLPPNGESLLVAAFLGGYPVGAQAVASACKNGQISHQDAMRMLSFCSNAGPSFLFGILPFFFPQRKYLWLLWAIHIFSAWMVSCLFKPSQRPAKPAEISFSFSGAMPAAVKTMGCVCGWVILFRVILAFGNRWFFWMLDPLWQVVLTGFLELSNGCCSLSLLENIHIRFVVCSAMLAMGGICVTMQTSSVIHGLPMKYYLIGKLAQCSFSLILSLACLYGMLWVPVLLAVFFGFICGKTKNSGSNPKRAVV